MDLLAATPQEFIDNATAISDAIQAGKEATWTAVLDSAAYTNLANLGAALGMVFFGGWIVRWLLHQETGELPSRAYRDLGLILLLVLLLGNPSSRGNLLGQVTRGVHDFSYAVNRQVLDLSNSIGGGEVVTEIGVQNAARVAADAGIQTCSTVADDVQRGNCYDQVKAQVSAIIQPFGAPPNFRAWSTQLYNELAARIEAAKAASGAGTGGPLAQASQAAAAIGGSLWGFLTQGAGQALTTAALGWMMLTGMSFLYFLEVVALVSAMLGPLAVGISLAPVAGRPAYAWASAFVGVGVARVCYGLIVSTAALLLYIGGGSEVGTVAFLTIVGLFGPVLALGLAVGGGITMFQSLLYAAAVLL